MASLPKLCFWSKQCEHQKAPYILAPAALRRFARSTARGGDEVLTAGICGQIQHAEIRPREQDFALDRYQAAL